MHIICSHMCSHSIVEECDKTAWFIKHVSGKTGGNGPLSSIISNNSFNLLCMNYNLMHFTSNTELLSMEAHRRNSAYSVLVLFDHFLWTNGNNVECFI